MTDLEHWELEAIPTKDEIMDFATELWKTASEFEKELQTSMKGHEIEMQRLTVSSFQTIEWIKHKTDTYITALEEALRMTKDKYNMEVENLNMRISEFESRMMSQEVEEPELTRILTQNPESIDNIKDFRILVKKLQNAGQSLKNQNTQYLQTI